MCKTPRVDTDERGVAELMARVAATVSRQVAALSENVYEVILREIPELHDDRSAARAARIRDLLSGRRVSVGAAEAILGCDLHVAFGDAARGTAGFRLTHQQAVAAQAVALAARPAPPRAVAFGEVAPVAMMLGAPELLRAWVLGTLAGLAGDDENHARLRETLLAFLHANGSYKATAEQLMLHKNTVQYRIRRAEESLGRPVSENPHDLELALRASHWLGSSVLQP